MPLPEAMRGPRQRRRPPREQWILAQPAAPAVEEPAEQALPAQEVDDEGEARGPRLRRPPDRYGIDKERTGEEEEEANLELNSGASSPDLSQEQSSLESPPDSRVPTPATSPDTSLNLGSSPFEPEWLPMTLPRGRTPQERLQDPLERHRHHSMPPGSRIPCGEEFQNWNPQPRRQLKATQPSCAEGRAPQ